MDIAGKRILLTGASGGLGEAIARELAARGAELVITARRRELLEDLARVTGAEVVVGDLANREDLERIDDVARGTDAVVLNAGIGSDGPIEELTAEQIDTSIDVNLRAPMHTAVAFAQHRIELGRAGQIVLMGSLSGLAATPNTRLYNATKFGLRGFALSLRQDLAPHGIGVSLVAPGFIRAAGMFADNDVELPPGVRTKSPSDVAQGVVTAIDRNPAEVYVSPVELRLGATLASLAPALSELVQRRANVADRTANH